MIKKFVSKALLSVVMDKSARDKREAARAAKTAGTAAPSGETERVDRKEPARPPAGEATVNTPEREALIRQALAVQKRKAHLLDDLSPAQRDKLKVMALQAFEPDELERLERGDRTRGRGVVKGPGAFGKRGRGR